MLRKLYEKGKNEQNCNRSDHGREFEISNFKNYCNLHGISHEVSSPIIPEQNSVVERKNRTLQEMDQVMLNLKKLSKRLWAEALNTTWYTINHVYLCLGNKKTPYEL